MYQNSRVLLLLFSLLSCFNSGAQDSSVNDSLFKQFSNTKLHDTIRLSAIHEIAWSYVFSDPDTAFVLANKELNFAKSKKQELWMGKAYNICGVSYHIKGQYDKAINYYKLSLEIRERINDKIGVAASCSNIGSIYFNQGDYVTALDYYYRSLKIEQEIGNKVGEAQTLNDIGLVFDEIADIDKDSVGYMKALGYYQKSIRVLERTDNKYARAAAYGNMGNSYEYLKDYRKAFYYHEQSLLLRKEINDMQGYAASLGNIGNIYQDIPDSSMLSLGLDPSKRFDYMIKYYGECYKIMEEIGDINGLALSMNNLSYVYYNQKDYRKALQYALDALKLSYEINGLEQKRDNHNRAYAAYKKLGNLSEALKHHELYSEYKDSMNQEENKKDIARKEISFEYEKKSTADSILRAEEKKIDDAKIEARDAKIKQEETLKYALVSGIILVIGFTLFLYNRFTIIKKQKGIIEEQKHIVEEKNREVLDSINYAKRLQDAILPPEKLWKSVFPESFIFYKPKDIIAGDFYFMEKIQLAAGSKQSTAGSQQSSVSRQQLTDNSRIPEKKQTADWQLPTENCELVVFAVADCTGHGVPGAMVSVVCANALNRAVKEFKLTDSGLILDKVRELVLETFEKSESEVNDGMDISLCVLDTKTLELKWSGANNPLWIVKKVISDESKVTSEMPSNSSLLTHHSSLLEFNPNKQPIGKIFEPEPFETHIIQLKKGDTLFLFSDGFADQFGGPKGKKFKYSQLQKLFLEICSLQPETRNQKLDTVFSSWKGELEQIDDVCIISIRI